MDRAPLLAAALLAVAAGAIAGYRAGSLAGPAQDAPELRAQLDAVVARLDSLERAQLRMALTGAAGEAGPRSADLAAAGEPPGAPRSSADRAASPDGSEGREGAGWSSIRDSMPLLGKLYASQNPDERRALAQELVNSPVPRLRLAGLRALVQVDPEAGLASVRELVADAGSGGRGQRIAAEAIGMLADVPGNAIDQELYGFTGSASPGVQRAALRTLERRGDPRPIQASIAAQGAGLQSKDAGTRVRALDELGDLRSPSAVPAITSMLADPDSGVRIEALQSLARTGAGPAAAAAIQPLLSDPVPAVRDTAVRALQRVSSPRPPRGDSRGLAPSGAAAPGPAAR